ncbi:hypothetical protein [Bdellovibrio sp. KM01]|uniref:hypothetical protein n=1 Tax=Bdellovibrio sp. KM01 TaxID=2748865 RepID=UPI0015EB0C4A|nr:hypothetical protein [Bdellovibrio sp. KM01]QLY23994.1 hypothetical protein HW988_10940 [Bdellovibrio sp. KM01]
MKLKGLVLTSIFVIASSTSMAADYSKSKNKPYPPPSNSENINTRHPKSSDPWARDDVSAMPTNPRVSRPSNSLDLNDFGRRAMEDESTTDNNTLRR